MKRGWIAFTALLLTLGCSKNDTIDPGTWNSYRNPVEQSDVQDPAVYEAEGKYYLFATGDSESILPMMESSDLIKWQLAISVFNEDTKPTFISDVTPESPFLAKVADKYVLYYTMYESPEKCGIGVAVADLPTGPYQDCGKLLTASDFGITGVASPSYFTDGIANYIVFGKFGGIYVIELSADGLGLASGAAPVKIASELYDAPYIKAKDGKFYLFASIGLASNQASSTCEQVVGRADNVYGPYFNKQSQPLMSDYYEVLMSSSTKFAGPGHGCLLDMADGSTWILYNAYDLSDVSKGRTLMLDRVDWQDGWPVVRGAIPSFCADAPALNN